MEFILAPQNYPFTIALSVMGIMAILESVGAMFGAGISEIADSLFPDNEWDMDWESPDLTKPSALGKALSWLNVGHVPILVLLIAFLLFFGLGGLLIQRSNLRMLGFLLPLYLSIPMALCVAIPLTRIAGKGLARILPKDESEAVSTKSFIGRIATITVGTSRQYSPAEARVKDRYGVTHYVMVEPDNQGVSFNQGDAVLLVKHDGVKFYAIRNTNENMIPKG